MPSKLKYFYEFEDFRLDAENANLWRAGAAVSIPPKALETLILLIRKKNEIVSRDELLDAVWKDTFVEEGNINYTVSQLRKILENKDLIQTVARRGYRFVGAVREVAENENAPPVEKIANQTAANETFENSVKKNGARWIWSAVAIVLITFLTSLAYFRPTTTAAKPPENLPSANPEARQAYTRGRMILEKKNTEKRVEKAIDEFQNAVTLDPSFALAYAGLAEGFASRAVAEKFPESSDYYAKARVAAEKSLALDANLAEGYMARGWIKRSSDWDWKNAEEDLRRAIQLNSKNATAHQRLAYLLCSLGRQDEAISEIKIAYELDPVADFIAIARFPILEARREYDAALKEAEQYLNENKNNSFARRAYATFLYHTSEYQKVIEISEATLQKKDGTAQNFFPWYSLLHAAYYKTNQLDRAEENLKLLETAAANDSKALYSLAMNYAELGRADDALAALETCFQTREERMVWLGVEPRFENLRRDERFQNLLKKMNFQK